MPFPRALLALEKPNSLVEAALAMNAALFGVNMGYLSEVRRHFLQGHTRGERT